MFEYRPRLRFAAGKRPRAHLLVVRRPGPGKVAVQVGGAVRQEGRRRYRRAVEVFDHAFRIQLVERAFIVDGSQHHKVRHVAGFDKLTRCVLNPHGQRAPVAVDITGAPERTTVVGPVVACVRAYKPVLVQHDFRAIR